MARRYIRTYTKGARVYYTGNDPKMKEAWGDSVQTVLHKSGDSVIGYFPMKYMDGSIHSCKYSVRIADLGIVY